MVAKAFIVQFLFPIPPSSALAQNWDSRYYEISGREMRTRRLDSSDRASEMQNLTAAGIINCDQILNYLHIQEIVYLNIYVSI